MMIPWTNRIYRMQICGRTLKFKRNVGPANSAELCRIFNCFVELVFTLCVVMGQTVKYVVRMIRPKVDRTSCNLDGLVFGSIYARTSGFLKTTSYGFYLLGGL